MALKFGTSGVRGLVSEFTDKEAYLLTAAFLKHTSSQSSSADVCIGMDLRESSPKISRAIERCLEDHHKTIRFCGVLPTPALAYYSLENKSLAIMVTGSHIPADRNGIKFYLTYGETLKSDDELIFANYESLQKENYKQELFKADGEFLKDLTPSVKDCTVEACSLFTNRYKNFFKTAPLGGMRILFYEHSSAARELLVKILEDLGASVIKVGYSKTFVPVDTEAVESIDLFKSWIQEHNADALVSTDGDGDRPLVIDNKGILVQGDKLGMICSQFLGIEAIALPISCNSGISDMPVFKKVAFTKIGSPYVVEELNNLSAEFKAVAGFEANGGYILSSTARRYEETLKALPTRDSVIPVLTLLAQAIETNSSVHDVVQNLPKRFTSSGLAKSCPTEQSQKILQTVTDSPEDFLNSIVPNSKIQSINTLDGVRITLTSNDIIHLRPSGNAPEFRCYTEANNQMRADNLSNAALKKIIQTINFKGS